MAFTSGYCRTHDPSYALGAERELNENNFFCPSVQLSFSFKVVWWNRVYSYNH